MHLAIDTAREELIRRMGAGRPLIGAAPTLIMPRADGVVPPMTDEQKHVWLHSVSLPAQPIYNEPITIRYRGSFDYRAFLRAFDDLLQRHEALRTSFDALDSDPVQIIHPELRADFPLIDLSDLAPAEREREAQAIAEADARKPFHLDQAPLFRGRIVRIADDDHRLYITLHHIIFDGASIYQVMMPELVELYRAHAAGDVPTLPAPQVRYGDYAVWQRQNARDGLYQPQIDYWRAMLDGALPMLDLPTDRAVPAVGSAKGSMEAFQLSEMLVARLKALSRAHGATLYMTLLAGFKTLLHRYGGQEDIIIGGVTDTRRRPELRRMIGYCLNAVPLRSRPRPDMPFTEFLAQVRGIAVGAIENSDVPFQQVVRSLRLDTGASRHPIFQVLFSIEPPQPALAADWHLSQMEVSPETAKLDLYLELDERHDGSMTGRLMYSTDLFDRETIVRMIGHWRTLLEGIVAAPETPLRTLGLLASGEETMLSELAHGAARAIPDTTIHDLIRQTAERTPNALAVQFGAERLTYAELIARVDALASQLRSAGVGPGALVGLCVMRSAEMVIAALAIMARGAAYLPLDPSFPAARLTAIVDDADPIAIVTQTALASQLPGWGKPVLLCDTGGESPHLRLVEEQDDPDAVAYVMYTSGSTGVPKGVEIQHRAAVNLLRSMQRAPGFAERDTLLAVATPTFDISVLEMFLPLISGGLVVIASSEETVDPEQLRAAIVRSHCTVMQATPATWQNLFATGWPGVPGLRIMCGGEALPGDLAERILAAGMTLWNVYGPTETTVWSSIQQVERGDDITIGRPIDNTIMLVLDRDGRRQPFNVAGELHIGGAGLARGYRDPALTARAFVLSQEHGRLYRTGDIARQRRDGRFEWLGRRDGQVKVRGLRIDLGDVEAGLAAHPNVAMAAVRTFDDESGQKSLAAYVVPREAPPPLPTDLRNFLRRTLPSYMLPARYVALEAMPLSSNGKIDRKALPDPGVVGDAVKPTEPPCGPCETKLAAVWMDLLGLDAIGAYDDFQELGGHSLLAARLMAQIERQFGRKLPLSTLLRAPTLRAMARCIQDTDATTDRVEIVTLKGGHRPPLFWIDAVPNFRPFVFRDLAGELGLDRPLLGLPIDVERHDALRETRALAELATDLAATIRAHGSGEPYLIGGWCNGGILAYEVAAQLIAGGGEVGLLVMLDAANPIAFRKRTTRMAAQLRQFRTLPRGQRAAFASETLEGYASRFYRRFQRDKDDTAELLDLNERFMRLVNAYEPAPLPAPVLLLEPRDGKIDHATGWRTVLSDQLTASDVAGGHASVLDQPHVADLGAQIERGLAAAGIVAETRVAAE